MDYNFNDFVDTFKDATSKEKEALIADKVLLIDSIDQGNLGLLLQIFQSCLAKRKSLRQARNQKKVFLVNFEDDWSAAIGNLESEIDTSRIRHVKLRPQAQLASNTSRISCEFVDPKRSEICTQLNRILAKEENSVIIIDSLNALVNAETSLFAVVQAIRCWQKLQNHKVVALWHQDVPMHAANDVGLDQRCLRALFETVFDVLSMAEPLHSNLLERGRSDAKLLLAFSKSSKDMASSLERNVQSFISKEHLENTTVQALYWKFSKTRALENKFLVNLTTTASEPLENYISTIASKCFVEETEETSQVILHSRSSKHSRVQEPVDAALSSLTFNLSLTSEQKKAREKMEHPFMAQIRGENKPSRESTIWYSAELDDDDFDEEDPDDDLDI